MQNTQNISRSPQDITRHFAPLSEYSSASSSASSFASSSAPSQIGYVLAPSHLTDSVDWPWPNFSPAEMACRHCGQGYRWPVFMDRLQQARQDAGRPFRILSAHRCALHNARIGGAPRSQHLRLAADISLQGHNPQDLAASCHAVGFTGFGYYQTFLHIDLGRRRHWFGGPKARLLWQTQ